MKKQLLLVGSGAYGALIQEAAKNLGLSLKVIDGRDVNFNMHPEPYVIIATPNFTHYDLVNRALMAGKHVLCEKPLALTGQEVKTLYHLAHKHEKYLGVGFVLPNHPYYQLVKEKQVEYGPIQLIRVYNHATEGELQPEWYWERKKSGGWFMIAEIHWYHLLFWLTSSQNFSITEATETKPNNRTVATWSVVTTDQNQQLQLEHRLDMNQQTHWTKVEVIYEDGAQVVLDDWVPRTMIIPGEKQVTENVLKYWREEKRLSTYKGLIHKNIEQLLKANPVLLPKEIELAHQAAQEAQNYADQEA